ncbi:MAG: T9SS type A sorting domain-containing protein [Cytophagales bacterium]|nr:T9SS type A sorting domain-containing protein [Cytophagales bacterium]
MQISNKLCAFVLVALCSLSTQAQNPTANIATWKNNASGAYSIVHDDYGLAIADGIWRYADTIAYNRGIKFVFGAYTELCETRGIQPNGYANLYSYAKNVMMEQHGHEIANHSYSHACAAERGWEPCKFGEGESGWGEAPYNSDFDLELDYAHNSIINGTGFTPRYYVYPYDVFSNKTNERLEELGYLGSRTGWSSPASADQWQGYHRNGYENSDLPNFFPNSNGFFRNSVEVFNDDDANLSNQGQLTELNNEIDNIIANNLYGNREFHNVGTSGWGHVSVEAYRGHMDYLKQKVDAGQLWVGTASEIFTYQLQKLKYRPSINYNDATDEIQVSWTSINSQYNINVGDRLDELVIKTPITLVVNLDGLSGTWDAIQSSQKLEVTQKSGKLYINVYPHEGNIFIRQNSNGNTTPYVENKIENQNLQENFAPYQINLTSVFQDIETSDGDLIYTVFGNSNIQVDIINGVATISSTQDWTGSETIAFEAEDEEGLKVSNTVVFTVNGSGNQTAYNGPHFIPGRIEAEDYDNGEEGEAYEEIFSQYEEDPSKNPYRVNHPVDVGEISQGRFGVGHTQTGEWLEYTVTVEKTGIYDFIFKTAQVQFQGVPNGEMRILLSGQEVLPAVTSVFTAGWGDYTDVPVSGVFLTEGKHIFRLEFTIGNVNIDYIDITLVNEAPYVNNKLSDYSLDQNFDAFTVNLNNVFEDAETNDEDLVYSVTGNSNIQFNIDNGIASISVVKDWTGVEVVTLSATDEAGLTTEHLLTFDVNLVSNINESIVPEVFNIYPNPSTGRFVVEGNVDIVAVYNTQGQLLLESENNEIDLSTYPSGLYFVRINNQEEAKRVLITK